MSTQQDNWLGVEEKLISDNTDIRDMTYSPTLGALDAELFPDHLLFDCADPLIVIKDQKNTQYCTGCALATVIDILRINRDLKKASHVTAVSVDAGSDVRTEPGAIPDSALETSAKVSDDIIYSCLHSTKRVSARMLFEMGRLVSARSTGSKNHRLSIRSTLKGFYHNGVCLEDNWKDDDPVANLTVERAKSARQISLGTYYRLRHFLSDYHCALAETGVILVSAMLHAGWRTASVRANNGIIKHAELHGAHAFVIVGYNTDGFLVLNSWKGDWCGEFSFNGQIRLCPGIALWRYEDWGDNVLDAWVLRLAVPTPRSFEYSVGSQGRRFGYMAGGRSSEREYVGSEINKAQAELEIATSRKSVIGHYVHFEQGKFVKNGSYPDSRASLDNTLNHIDRRFNNAFQSSGKKPPEHIYLRIIGDSGSVKDAMHRVSALKRRLQPRRVYPLSFVWSSELTNAFAVCIRACMQEAIKQIPEPSDERDDLIELMVRPIGEPLWKQMGRDAQCVAESGGPLQKVFDKLNATLDVYRPDTTRKEGTIDLTFECAGALVFVAWMNELGNKAIDTFRHVRHVHLVMPMVESLELARSIRSVVPDAQNEADDFLEKIKLYIPRESFLGHSSIGYYQRTWFHMVNNSFMADNAGDKSREMVSLDPDDFCANVRHFWPDASYRRIGFEMERQEDKSAQLRWHMVEDKFLDLIFPAAGP